MSSTLPPATPTPPSSLGVWVLAARPKTLTAAVAPVLLGTGLAFHEGHFRPLEGALALMGALLLQIASNFANDVFDFEKGADTQERLGPLRAVHAGLLTPLQMKRGLLAVLGAALVVGAALAVLSGPWVVLVGLASIGAALAYTGGPYPLGYHGLGDLFVLIFFGFVAVLGTVRVHGAPLSFGPWLLSAALGALATLLLIVNNIRDRYTDQKAGKRTLAVRWGRAGVELEARLLTGFAFLAPVIAVVTETYGAWLLLPLALAPLGFQNLRLLHELEGQALNSLLGRVARLVLLYGLTTLAGLLIDRGLS